MIRSHAAAVAYLRGGRDHTSRPLPGKATRLERRGSAVAVRYHETDVVTFHADGSITLDRGDWLTVTTRARMEEYTGLRITGRMEPYLRGPDEVWTVATPDGQHSHALRDGVPFTPGH